MMIVEIEGKTLTEFLAFLDQNRQASQKAWQEDIRMLRISLDGDTIKAKANERMWTASLGPVTVME